MRLAEEYERAGKPGVAADLRRRAAGRMFPAMMFNPMMMAAAANTAHEFAPSPIRAARTTAPPV